MKKTLFTLTFITTFFTSSVLADSFEFYVVEADREKDTVIVQKKDTDPRSFYVGGTAGISKTDYEPSNLASTITDSTGESVGVFFGYQYTNNLGAELRYTKYGDTTLTPSSTIDTSGFGLYFNASYLTLDNKVKLTGLLGGHQARVKTDNLITVQDEEFGFSFGAQASYAITNNINIGIEALRVSGEIDNYSLFISNQFD